MFKKLKITKNYQNVDYFFIVNIIALICFRIFFNYCANTNFNKIGGAIYMSKSKDTKNDKNNNNKGTKKSNPKQDTNTMEGK